MKDTENKTPYQRLIEHFGTPANAAKQLGVNRQAMTYWKRNGIPETRAYQIEIATDKLITAQSILEAQKQGEAA